MNAKQLLRTTEKVFRRRGDNKRADEVAATLKHSGTNRLMEASEIPATREEWLRQQARFGNQ